MSLKRPEQPHHKSGTFSVGTFGTFSVGIYNVGCSHVAAGQIAERLVGLGILAEQTSRSRHKLFVAGDLMRRDLIRGDRDRSGVEEKTPLSLSEPAPSVDVDALAATLDGLFADLDRLNERAKDRMGTKG